MDNNSINSERGTRELPGLPSTFYRVQVLNQIAIRSYCNNQFRFYSKFLIKFPFSEKEVGKEVQSNKPQGEDGKFRNCYEAAVFNCSPE